MNAVDVQAREKLQTYICIAGGARFGKSLKACWREAAKAFGVTPERIRNIWRGRTMPDWNDGEAMRLIALSLADEQAQELAEYKLELARQENQHELLKSRAARYYQRSSGADQGARTDISRCSDEAGPGGQDRPSTDGDPPARPPAA